MKPKQPQKENETFDISIWRRASIKNRRSREQYRLQTLKKVWKAVGQLHTAYRWDELYVFGSVTKPERFRRHSDIDIGISGLDKFLHYRFISDLSGLLEKDVDVVRLEDCVFPEVIKTRGIRWKKKR